MKIEIELGDVVLKGAGGQPAIMDIEELLATRLLVQGNSGSGKSHLIRRILEQSAGKVQQIIIDPEGDFVSLSDRFGHIVVDARRSDVELETIALRIRQARVSAVLNLEHLEVDGQMRAAGIFLNALFDADREFWHPALVVVDEAQLFAPTEKGEFSEEARRISLGAMTNLMCRGRKRGLAGIIATQRLAKVAKNVAAEASNFLMGRTSLDSGAAHRGPAWSGGRSAASAPSGSFRCPPVPRYRLPGNGLPCSFWPSRPDGTVHQTRRPRPDARSRNSLGRSFLCDGREVCLRTYYLRLRSARMRARGRKRIECRKFGI